MIRIPSYLAFGCALLFLVALTSCRTYGGYDTEARTYEEMEEAVQELEDSGEEAELSLQRLRAAAEQEADLAPLVDRYQTLLETHRAMIETQTQTVASFSPDASYRSLHRTYGAIVTDQRLLRRQYDRTVRRVYEVAHDASAPVPAAQDPSTYSITPLGYPRGDRALTMAEALDPVPGVPGLEAPAER